MMHLRERCVHQKTPHSRTTHGMKMRHQMMACTQKATVHNRQFINWVVCMRFMTCRFRHHPRMQPSTGTESCSGCWKCRLSRPVWPKKGLRRLATDRKSVVKGKSGSVRVDRGGRRHIKKKNQIKQ